MMEQKKLDELLKLAVEARDRSYSPYSHFRVSAALLRKACTSVILVFITSIVHLLCLM